MNKLIGVVLLVVGVFLLVRGHDMSNSVNSQVKNLFTGSPTDRVMYFYLAGTVCCAVGAVMVFFWSSKK